MLSCGMNPWNRTIPLPGGGALRTLAEARAYILALPKRVHRANYWQTAIGALLVTVEHKGPTDFARIGIMKALHLSVDANSE